MLLEIHTVASASNTKPPFSSDLNLSTAHELELAKSATESTLSAPLREFQMIGAGANSKVYKAATDEQTVAVKSFPPRRENGRDRLDTEWHALSFLQSEGISSAPRPYYRDDARQILVMEWIDGVRVTRHSGSDLTQALGFMAAVLKSSENTDQESFNTDIEACLSESRILEQIRNRLTMFTNAPELEGFLERSFLPRLDHWCASNSDLDSQSADLPLRHRRLVAADFGFHNALRQADGRLRFFDFDYFGWDDPVKMAADFLLHPAMSLTYHDKRKVVEAISTELSPTTAFLERLKRLLPLYVLRWTLILLNTYRRDRQTNKDGQFSSRPKQLAKARKMLTRYENPL